MLWGGGHLCANQWDLTVCCCVSSHLLASPNPITLPTKLKYSIEHKPISSGHFWCMYFYYLVCVLHFVLQLFFNSSDTGISMLAKTHSKKLQVTNHIDNPDDSLYILCKKKKEPKQTNQKHCTVQTPSICH